MKSLLLFYLLTILDEQITQIAIATPHSDLRSKIIGEMVEWSITVVLKTTVPRGTGGSNPSLSAESVTV